MFSWATFSFLGPTLRLLLRIRISNRRVIFLLVQKSLLENLFDARKKLRHEKIKFEKDEKMKSRHYYLIVCLFARKPKL